MNYFADLTIPKKLLWCYLIWYLTFLAIYFDPKPDLWINSATLGILVGTALFLSSGEPSYKRFQSDFWREVRLFLCPFLVSSFASLTKNRGFFALFSAKASENLLASALCLTFLISCLLCQRYRHRSNWP